MQTNKFSSLGLFCLFLNACAHAPPAPAFVADTCAQVQQAWPRIVADTEGSMRAPNEAAFRVALAKIESELADPMFEGCPARASEIAMQRATVGEFAHVYAIGHLADDGADAAGPFGGIAKDTLTSNYVQMHDQACIDASPHMDVAWQAWSAQDANVSKDVRKQRYLSNLERDEYLVHADGSLGGATDLQNFVALVKTPVLEELSPAYSSMQGQGPMVAQEANNYVGAAMRYAAHHHIDKVAFVNTAGGQVPSFEAQVAALSQSTGVHGIYLQYDGWRDGTLVTPRDAAVYAARVAEELDPARGGAKGSSTLLVVNCNAGMDRSGTINALVQLVLQAQHNLAHGMDPRDARAQGFASIPAIVHNIKEARPRAISSIGRYLFIYQAYDAYWQWQQPAFK